jgi:hypothetical protein
MADFFSITAPVIKPINKVDEQWTSSQIYGRAVLKSWWESGAQRARSRRLQYWKIELRSSSGILFDIPAPAELQGFT